MKNIFLLMAIAITIIACGPTTGESGANDDGIKAVDSNGAFQDTAPMTPHPSTDTAIGEDRVDLQRRDSANMQ